MPRLCQAAPRLITIFGHPAQTERKTPAGKGGGLPSSVGKEHKDVHRDYQEEETDDMTRREDQELFEQEVIGEDEDLLLIDTLLSEVFRAYR